MVIPTAYDTWKVTMGARRNQAKLHVRISSLNEALVNDRLPPWAFGITQMPDYLQPLPTDIVKLMKQQAQQVAEYCLATLKTRCAAEQHKADMLSTTCRQFYDHEEDSDFNLAEMRLLAMATQARNREAEQQRRQRAESTSQLPTTDEEWAATLPRRRTNNVTSTKTAHSPITMVMPI